MSMDAVDDSRLCRDERKLKALLASRCSISGGLLSLSLFLFLEKMDRPPECFDLSADDMVAVDGRKARMATY